ncbi:unnamed protein product [Thelazia callipaeda]|uniref:IntS14_C domain-containing protein n=1 Tax=Thelazia callipaeda TaxID=103827 RepID=A0A0N5CL85_THECL|nr:unnamed protein product [Thelazia callipaeda]
MTLFLALDSSLSMRLPVNQEDNTARWVVARKLAIQLIEKVRILDPDRKIKLIDFSHNSKIVSCDIRRIEEVAKKLKCINVSASADLIALFLLVKMENDNESSILLVFTDACTFTPEEVNLKHLPNCSVSFVCVLDENLTNSDQIARFWAISLQTKRSTVQFEFESCESSMPFFLSDYDDIEACSEALAKKLCPEPTFTLNCGFLKAEFKVIPSGDSYDWDSIFEIIGFIPVNCSYVPTIRHHFVLPCPGSEDMLNILCAAMHADESMAICHISENLYAALCSICSKEEDDFTSNRLLIALFPSGICPVPWLPPLTTLCSQNIVDTENYEQSFCVSNDNLSIPSYFSQPRTCWYEPHGLQSDMQKISRLLKKIPDKMFLFYTELSRIHAYCCATGAEDILEKLIQILREESSKQMPLIVKHCLYAIEELR